MSPGACKGMKRPVSPPENYDDQFKGGKEHRIDQRRDETKQTNQQSHAGNASMRGHAPVSATSRAAGQGCVARSRPTPLPAGATAAYARATKPDTGNKDVGKIEKTAVRVSLMRWVSPAPGRVPGGNPASTATPCSPVAAGAKGADRLSDAMMPSRRSVGQRWFV